MATRCLSVVEVAGLLTVSRDAVYDLIERGEIVAVRVGRRLSITETEFEAFIARSCTKGSQ